MSGRVVCTACGGEIPQGAKFCGECGAKSGPMVCAACGNEVPRAKFCGECGAKLEAASAPSTAAPKPAAEAPRAKPAAKAAAKPAAKPAAAARKAGAQPGGLREWLKEQHQPGPSMLFQRPEDVETMAAALRRVRDQGGLPEDIFKTIHGAMQFRAHDGVYTVALGSLTWHRLDGGKWVPAERPSFLFLEAPKIDQAAAAARPGTPVVTPGGGGS